MAKNSFTNCKNLQMNTFDISNNANGSAMLMTSTDRVIMKPGSKETKRVLLRLSIFLVCDNSGD